MKSPPTDRMQIEESSRKTDVAFDVDVVVCGGGTAGIAAAVCAARQGAKVRLIEAGTCLGGLGTAGLVPAFPIKGRPSGIIS